jgi:hypothetical protein
MEADVSDVNRFPMQPGCGPIYAKLYELLKTTDGETLTDEAIQAHLGRPVSPASSGQRGSAYGILLAVIRRMEKEGRVWRRMSKANAIKLCTDVEKARETDRLLRTTRRTTRRAAVVVAAVKIENIPMEDRPALHAKAAQIGALAMFADVGTTRKLEVRSKDNVPDLKSVLQLMSS